jgi:hypothetical protein
MNNVIKLFARKDAGNGLSEPEALIAAAETKVSALTEQLSHKVNELSKHFDSI